MATTDPQTDSEPPAEEQDGSEPLVPEGVLEGVEDTRNGEFATKDSLLDSLF